MFGPEFLISPVLDPSSSSGTGYKRTSSMNSIEFRNEPVSIVQVYIPSHTDWVHLWSGQTVKGGINGRLVSVDAPFGNPPVFYREGSEAGKNLKFFIDSLKLDSITVINKKVAEVRDENCEILSDVIELKYIYDSPDGTNKARDVVKKVDRCSKSRVSEIIDYSPPTWLDWLGVSEYVISSESIATTVMTLNSTASLMSVITTS
jgi:alpha-glucosidase (family GH31 glycosyl hydrolase)